MNVEKARRPQTPLAHLTSLPVSPIRPTRMGDERSPSMSPQTTPVRQAISGGRVSPQQEEETQAMSALPHKATPARPKWPTYEAASSRRFEIDDKEMTFSFIDDDPDTVRTSCLSTQQATNLTLISDRGYVCLVSRTLIHSGQ